MIRDSQELQGSKNISLLIFPFKTTEKSLLLISVSRYDPCSSELPAVSVFATCGLRPLPPHLVMISPQSDLTHRFNPCALVVIPYPYSIVPHHLHISQPVNKFNFVLWLPKSDLGRHGPIRIFLSSWSDDSPWFTCSNMVLRDLKTGENKGLMTELYILFLC